MKLKFPIPRGVGEVQGDHLQARKCYVEAVCKRQKRNPGEDRQGAPLGRKGKETWQKEPQGKSRYQQRYNLQKNC
ncbi:UNVERIFIED_CONTAM: hypothetical protein Sradi_4396800 [Sesamum radiatum]|uniref:Uncharacterized protein n=1 Tax=Sesamum radiatum TaxID=300843 RepID=A0AAW2NRT9_SESRA